MKLVAYFERMRSKRFKIVVEKAGLLWWWKLAE